MKRRERPALIVLFAVGTGLIIASLTYAALRSWPTFDPLASATLIGIGLLLVVIHERLGAILQELRELVALTRDTDPTGAPRRGSDDDR